MTKDKAAARAPLRVFLTSNLAFDYLYHVKSVHVYSMTPCTRKHIDNSVCTADELLDVRPRKQSV